MKRLILLCLMGLLLFGCNTMNKIMGKKTADPMTGVPAANVAQVNKAKSALSTAEAEVRLEEMRKELAGLFGYLAGYNLDYAKNVRDGKELELQVSEAEAHIAAGGQDVESLRKDVAGYQEDIRKNTIKRYDITNDIKKTEFLIKDLKARIAVQESKVAEMKGVKAATPAVMTKKPLKPLPARPTKSGPISTTVDSNGTVVDDTKVDATKTDDNGTKPAAVKLPDYLKVTDDPATKTDANGTTKKIDEGGLTD